ncbi:MAG: hypothetical protein HYZ49_09505 [Chloroflexi bacterium]|nr:hypothetical protein [Chloroflexota bacterium]
MHVKHVGHELKMLGAGCPLRVRTTPADLAPTTFDAVGELLRPLLATDFVTDVTDSASIRYIRYLIRCRFRQQYQSLRAHGIPGNRCC